MVLHTEEMTMNGANMCNVDNLHKRWIFITKTLLISTYPKQANNGKRFHPNKYFESMIHPIKPIAKYISNTMRKI
jgi:hypothetical protein